MEVRHDAFDRTDKRSQDGRRDVARPVGGTSLRGRRCRAGAGSERGHSKRCDLRAQDPDGCDRPQHGRAGRNASSGKAINLAEGHEHADAISVMLMAFPHLFPPSTDQWRPNVDRDPGRDTYASPDVWMRFADFYAQAANASKVAYNASRTQQEAAFKSFVASLRTACDSCHAVYLKGEP